MTLVVLSHVHEKDAGIYRLTVGRDVTPEGVEEPVHEFAFDVVFAEDDDRWHTGEGRRRKRRPDEEIAAEQRQLLKDQLKAHERERRKAEQESNVRDLPGAGDPL